MDIISGLVSLFFIVMIIYYIKDIKDLIIPTKRTPIDILSVAISITVILIITYLYAKTLPHYIFSILAIVFLILSLKRTGINSKGILFIGGLTIQGKWSKIHSVQVSLKRDVRVSIILSNFNLGEIVHYYKKENYNEIITLLLEHLPNEIVNI